MHVISRKAIREFGEAHPDADAPLDRWYRVAIRAEWANFGALRADYPSADQVGKYVVFNIGGNKYRLVAEINYGSGLLFIRGVYTHAGYDEIDFTA